VLEPAALTNGFLLAFFPDVTPSFPDEGSGNPVIEAVPCQSLLPGSVALECSLVVDILTVAQYLRSLMPQEGIQPTHPFRIARPVQRVEFSAESLYDSFDPYFQKQRGSCHVLR